MADDIQMNPTGPTSEPKKDMSSRTVMGVLAYIGPLVIVPFLTSKDDPFVKFHVKQGLVLFVIEVALWVIQLTIWVPIIGLVFGAIRIGLVVLSIVGIVYVVQNKETELPLLGQFAKYFKI